MFNLSHKSSDEETPPLLISNNLLYRRIFSLPSLLKFIILGVFIVAFYFIPILFEYYENSTYSNIITILIMVISFFFWVSSFYLVFSITATEIEKSLLRKLFSLLLIMGILTAYFAVLIENKSFSLISVFFTLFREFGLIPTVGEFVFDILYVFVIPVIEELVKIFPIMILLGNYAQLTIKQKKIHTRLTPSFRIILIFGAFFGAWFDLFEQFLSFSANPTGQDVSGLILGRSIYPLHIVTTIIASFGLAWFFKSRKKYSVIIRSIIFGIFFLFAVCFHGLWNYYSVAFASSSASTLILSILRYTSYALFLVFLIWILLHIPSYCQTCYTEHSSEECVEKMKSKSNLTDTLQKKRNIRLLYSKSSHYILCPECRNYTYNGEFCLNCWSYPKIQCSNCNQILPAFTRICWSCGIEVPTLYDKMTSSSPPFYVSAAVGFTRIIGAGMLISFIFAFLSVSNDINSLGQTIFLLAVIFSIFTAIVWYAFEGNKVKSMISSMSIISVIAISIIITSLYVSIFAVLMIISIVQIVFGLIGLSCVLLISIISFYFIKKTLKGARLIIT